MYYTCSYKLSIIYKTRRKMDELRTELSQRQNGHTPSSSSEHSPTLRARDSIDGDLASNVPIQQQNGHTPNSSPKHPPTSRGRDSTDGDLVNLQILNGHTPSSSPEHTLVRRPPLALVLRGTHWYHDMETGICSFNNY